ncbi:MAG: hypothetical protein ACI80V_001889 [Rhodothermales bacterium]|jgi:hypothetical protein
MGFLLPAYPISELRIGLRDTNTAKPFVAVQKSTQPRMHRTFLALCLLTLAACDEPAPVGVGLVDAQSGEPFVITTLSSGFSATQTEETTGNAPRVLFGILDDATFGTTEALGYVDFVSPGILTSAFEDNVVQSASLLLATNYVFGDSLSDIAIQLRSIESAWLGSGVTSDTTLHVGALVTGYSVNYSTRTLEIPLPDDWVARWDTTIRGTSFDDSFHGFEVSTTSRTGVFGFDILGSTIQAVAGGDTTLFFASRSLTRFVGNSTPPVDPDGFAIQDGGKRGMSFGLEPFLEDTRSLALNRGIVRIPADTSYSANLQANYVRPIVDWLVLDWVSSDGTRTPIALSQRVAGRFDFQSNQLHDSLATFVAGNSGLSSFELRVPDLVADGSVNSVSVIRIPHATATPSLLLTVTPIQ